MAHRRLRIHDISRYPRLLQTTVPARLSGYAAHDGLLQPNRIPLRHRRHGLGRYCAESAAEWDQRGQHGHGHWTCLLYTSDAADERSSVDLGGRRIIKKKKKDE